VGDGDDDQGDAELQPVARSTSDATSGTRSIEHLANLGDLGEAILATGSVSGELLCEPSAELRANLAGSPVRLFTPYQSM